jgi:hypothetical protein
MMPTALPEAEIVHAMPGRMRLRIPARRGDAVFFASVATGLSTIAGIDKVGTRPLTGSILIHHNAPLARVTEAAEKARLFVVTPRAASPGFPEAISLDPRMVVGLGLGVLALWQLTQGRVLPRAATLAWYAANLTGLVSIAQRRGGE